MTTLDQQQSKEAAHRSSVEPVLVVEQLRKRYGWQMVLKDVGFVAYPGECLVILGPNGAGKSTLLRILAGLTRPTEGKITWFDRPFPEQASQVRPLLGFVGHRTMLDPELTVQENLDYYARLYAVPHRRECIIALAAQFDLLDRLGQRVGFLSRGLQQRVALVRALLHAPIVLLLDEPDTGLDQASRERLVHLVHDHCAQGGTVLLTTHTQEISLQLADRALYLEKGKLVWLASSRRELAEQLRTIRRELAPT